MKTARATIVEYTPSSGVRGHAPTRLAYDIADDDGGGRFMVTEKDEPRARELLWQGVTVRFDPQDQFAMLVFGDPAREQKLVAVINAMLQRFEEIHSPIEGRDYATFMRLLAVEATARAERAEEAL